MLRPKPHGVIAEVTRAEDGATSDRRDRAEILIGNRVPDASGRSTIVCPELSREGHYLTFGGNGHRHGLGYRLVGETGGGWLTRCGYTLPIEGEDPTPVVRQFLADLGTVAELLGLVVVGLDPRSGGWSTLEEMQRLAARRRGYAALGRLHLRVYGLEDYLDRLRRHFEQAGGFSCIPSNAKELAPVTEAHTVQVELIERLRGLGMTQKEVASALGVNQSMVSKILSGEPLSDRLRPRVEALLAARNRGREG